MESGTVGGWMEVGKVYLFEKIKVSGLVSGWQIGLLDECWNEYVDGGS